MTRVLIEKTAANDAIMEQFLLSRGCILTAFGQVEWFMAKLLIEAHAYAEYKNLNLDFSIQAETRAKKLRVLLGEEGPLKKYESTLIPLVDEVMSYAEIRNFMAHGVCVTTPSNEHSILFRVKMFKRMPGADDHEGKIDFTVDQLAGQTKALSTATVAFVHQVRLIWQELGMKNFDVVF